MQTHNDMGVSKNRDTPKSSILRGFSIINYPFWGTPIFGNTHMQHDVLLLHAVGLKPSGQEIHQKDAQNLRWIEKWFNGDHLELQGESMGRKERQRKNRALGISFFPETDSRQSME